ncbi:hypothetical protein FQN54_004975 [Arachnomyces sp. PD_36]|nr:hypothetical protein FQN54_004975 [Arachnomyces sp. PD_36]
MTDQPSPSPSSLLDPPKKSVELEDPGAPDSVSESEEDHFSDASEGRRSSSRPTSGRFSPVPRTKVERVDDTPSYGEIPGSPAYGKRAQDAVPDEVEIVPEGSRSRRQSTAGMSDRPSSPSGGTTPRTVVEKVDPESPSYGDVPGTEAYDARKADAPPDVILKASEDGTPTEEPSQDGNNDQGNIQPPETLLTRVDSLPTRHANGFTAHRRSPSDALPDAEETIHDTSGFSNPSARSSSQHTIREHPQLTDDEDHEDQEPENVQDDNDDEDFGDDFSDFKDETAEDDDFGDFDDGFQAPTDELPPAGEQTPPASTYFPPLLDFESLKTLPNLLSATASQLDSIFPSTKDVDSLPKVDPIRDDSAIFTNDRSLSLWSQLVAPPPLQPPNWIKSRIRRLFLVSLGVPVDLDEILPASKQKKLVLPSINLDGTSPSTSSDLPRAKDKRLNKRQSGDQQHPSNQDSRNDSSLSLDSSASRSRRNAPPRRRGPPPPPELDLSALKRLCATTDAALDGLTDEELRAHIKVLEESTKKASESLEYWLKRRDAQLGEKEAFEGVIENLVKHVRRVRK